MKDKVFKIERGAGAGTGVYLLIVLCGCLFFSFANFMESDTDNFLLGMFLILVTYPLGIFINWNFRGYDEVIFKETEVSIRRRRHPFKYKGDYAYENCIKFSCESAPSYERINMVKSELICLKYMGGRMSFCQGWEEKELRILTKRLNEVLESRKSNLTSEVQ
jgi:hypothetical protein